MAEHGMLDGRAKVNPYQTYISDEYRLNADGQWVQNQAPQPTVAAITRFLAKVQISETLFWNETPCWEWIGCKSKSGYGQFRFDGRRGSSLSSPHRFAYEYYIGDIPDGYEVDHLCGVRHCCNPAHLEAVTLQENRVRRNAKQTHCKHGHEFTPENTLIAQGRRRCRACNARRVADFYQRNPGYNAAQCRAYQAKRQVT